MSGNSYQEIGHYDDCQDLDYAHFCLLSYGLPSPSGDGDIPLKTGICVPIQCSAEDLLKFKNQTLRVLSPLLPAFKNFTDFGEFDTYCSLKDLEPMTPGAIVVVCVICLLVLFAIIGGVAEWYYISRHTDDRDGNKTSHIPEEQRLVSVNSDVPSNPLPRPPKFFQIMMCWSPITNFQKLVAPTSAPHLASLNGLRVFSMFWVILGHTCYWGFFSTGFSNFQDVFSYYVSSWWSGIILNATLSVDSFFYLSGFLVTYLVMQELYKKKRINLVLYVFHRFWRILPPYFLALSVLWQLLPHLGEGPFWPQVDTYVSRTSCDKYWWANLLFINNFVPKEYQDQCMGWSWYLANDMQMYLISPIFLFLYFKSKVIAIIVIEIVLVASIFAQGYVAWVLEFSCMAVKMATNDVYQNEIYEKPYMRLPTYLIGMLAAFVLLEFEKKRPEQRKFKWWQLVILYSLAFLCMYFPIFGSYSLYNGTEWNSMENVLMIAFSRPLFAIGLAIMMHTFFLGHGYLLRKVFEWEIWGIMARVTFSAYLYHPILMSISLFGGTVFFHYTPVAVAFRWLGFVLGAYILALISFLLVERPVMSLEKFLFPGRGH